MEYLFDTANLEQIEAYGRFIPVTGITSNPSIVKKEGKIDFFSHMKKIRELIGLERTLHIQVTGQDFDSMMADAEAILEKVDDQVYIKVPVTLPGLQAIRELKAREVHVTATAIYTEMQGFLAMEAGADYIAPYYNRMENSGIDPQKVIASFAQMIKTYGYATKILAASFKNMGQVNKAFLAGAQTATMGIDIIQGAFENAMIQRAVDDFAQDWSSVFGDCLISQMK